MKIAVACQSPLLQKSLELFLAKYLCSEKKSDIVVRDELCVGDEKSFYIGSDEAADLKKPFSKSQLILALEKRYKKLYVPAEASLEKKSSILPSDFTDLEEKIDDLTKAYQANILQVVKEFYEAKT